MKIRQWFKLAGKIWRSNSGSLEHPYKLTYVITRRCHSRCSYCDIWKSSAENELSLEEITLFAQNTPYWSWIDFTGGEPTDRIDFVDIVKVFLEHSRNLLLVHFPTNGLRPDHIAKICRELLKLSPPKLVVTVSIDGPPQVNDQLRGIPGDFEHSVETLLKLGQLGTEVYAGMTLFPENMLLIDETVTEIRKRIPSFDHRSLHVNLPNVSKHFYGNQDSGLNISSEMVEIMQKLIKSRGVSWRAFSWMERIYQSQVRKYLETGECPLDCAALLSSCYLAADGTVFPCSIWSEPLGSIRDCNYVLDPLLESDRAKELRKRLLKKNCSNCWTPCEAYQTILANLWRR